MATLIAYAGKFRLVLCGVLLLSSSGDLGAAPLNLNISADGFFASCPDNTANLPTCDYSPLFDDNKFWVDRGSLSFSGTAFSTPLAPGPPAAIDAIALTGPPPIPAPPEFLPPTVPGAAADMYLGSLTVGGGGIIQASHVFPSPPLGPFTMLTGVAGYVYYPFANQGQFSLDLTHFAPGCSDGFTVGGNNFAGPAGNVVPFAFSRSVRCPAFAGGLINHIADLNFNVGAAVVFLPTSADYVLVPEPASLTTLGIGLLYAMRRFRHQIARSNRNGRSTPISQ
jgi:hypothetical protein